ncbi:hypothetical protein [Microbacterium sp. T32]|uniref:hypothetical protein n=1 Tax=Microbacterium sp. T32 TaxID=1776083 RepID=UPI0012E9288B|nr:hypothetical protein [Microbacterium sp. T32]
MAIPVGLAEVEESDVELDAAGGRSKPRYPMDPDELERVYDRVRAYRAEKKAQKEAKERDKAADATTTIEVVEFAHELEDPAAASGAVGTLARRLLGHHWEVEISRSVVHIPAVLYAADSDEGDEDPHLAGDIRYEEHDLETIVIQAAKRAGGQMLALQGTWERKHREGKKPTSDFKGARTYDPILGQEWRTTQKTPRKPRDWEASEGVSGPLGLTQWLDLVAPPSGKPKDGGGESD